MNPQVLVIPRVSYDTADFTGRCVPAPTTGTVSAGMGAVCKNPTHGLPVLNPNYYLLLLLDVG